MILYLFILILFFYFTFDYFLYLDNDTVARAIEPIKNYFIYGNIYSASSDELFEDHYRFPPDFMFNFFIGFPFRTDYNLHYFTDVGYLQLLINFGFLLFSIFLLYIFYLLGISFYLFVTKGSVVSFFVFTLLIIIVILSFKGPYFFSRGVFDVFLIFLAKMFVDYSAHKFRFKK